jgi:hypothetical protein
MDPFSFLNSINQTKKPLMDEDPNCEREYIPFLINRGLSYFIDTIALANQMNQTHWLDKKMQFEFLRSTVRSRKRFSKWHKSQQNERIDALKTLYGYSEAKARQVMDLISEPDWKKILEQVSPGGTNLKFHK